MAPNYGAPPVGISAGTVSTSMTYILPDLDRLQAAATKAASDIASLRIEKWKADSETKRQAQTNADSVQRNLTSALPKLIEDVRSAPQDLNAEFKLYRNLNALYDVFGSLTESAGAFGPRSDYDAMAQQFQVIGSVRHSLGDSLERLTASTQSELAQLRSQIQAQQQAAAAAAAAPPKKVVVDDNEPAPKVVHKKKKPVTSGDSAGSGTSTSNSGNDPTSPPKP
jgi:hypothetical protein